MLWVTAADAAESVEPLLKPKQRLVLDMIPPSLRELAGGEGTMMTSLPRHRFPQGRLAVTSFLGSVSLMGLLALPLLLVAAKSRLDVADILSSTGFILVFTVFGGLGILLSVRCRDNPIGPMFTVAGALMTVGIVSGLYAEARLPGEIWAVWLTEWLPLLALPFLPLILLVFPEGALLSPRWRPVMWAAVISGGWLALGTALTPGDMADSGRMNPLGIEAVRRMPLLKEGGLGWTILLFAFVGSALSLVLRFRGSRGVERQQMKGLAAAAALLGVLWLAVTALWQVLGDAVYLLMIPAFAGLPIATTIAILRYRLYDIDIVINRTLVYTVLTAVLIGTYSIAVLVFGTLLDPVTQDNNVAIAASTLAVAALLRPARRAIQNFIDRRFYRSRYNAGRTIEAFATRLRDEVDLDALANELRQVVAQSLQPAHCSLWLRTP